MKNKIAVIAMLGVLLSAPAAQAKTLKDVLDNATTTKIATVPALVVGGLVKGVLHLLTLPFYFAEKIAK